jgi:type II secretory pathway pseudopilin PulG
MFPTRTSSSPSRQEGFTLAALIVILTVISIIIAFTVPEQWSLVLKRERDRQTIFLMKQYARGILNWRMKHNSVPVSLDQLVEARNPRMLRGNGKWPCPITGKEDDWILVPPGAVQGGGAAPSGAPPAGEPVLGWNPGRDPGSTSGSGPGELNPDASPDDYVGPFIGVRPKAKGKSFVALKGAENYEEWVYTVDDLTLEIQTRIAGLSTP